MSIAGFITLLFQDNPRPATSLLTKTHGIQREGVPNNHGRWAVLFNSILVGFSAKRYYVARAVKIKENVKVPAEKFAVPAGFELK